MRTRRQPGEHDHLLFFVLTGAMQNTQRQTTHVQHASSSRLSLDDRFAASSLSPDRFLTRPHSPAAILPCRNLKLNSSPITIYPSLNASLMQAIKFSNVGRHIARLLEMLCVKEGRLRVGGE